MCEGSARTGERSVGFRRRKFCRRVGGASQLLKRGWGPRGAAAWLLRLGGFGGDGVVLGGFGMSGMALVALLSALWWRRCAAGLGKNRERLANWIS